MGFLLMFCNLIYIFISPEESHEQQTLSCMNYFLYLYSEALINTVRGIFYYTVFDMVALQN
jgi:hypothetical protein